MTISFDEGGGGTGNTPPNDCRSSAAIVAQNKTIYIPLYARARGPGSRLRMAPDGVPC